MNQTSKIKTILTSLLLLFSIASCAADFPTSERAENAIAGVEARLKSELSAQGLAYGAPIFIRIFKQPGTLEVWVQSSDGEFKRFKSYAICTFSGNLGPKVKEGDFQSPEGFYYVNANRLNPWSSFHLSFNLGYPNAYDRYHKRTGSALMVHGSCVSIGCYAMTNAYIDEIYALAVAALKAQQPYFRVHVFPFKLEPQNLSQYTANKWYPFWLNLKQGYDLFLKHKKPPNTEVSGGKYMFNY